MNGKECQEPSIDAQIELAAKTPCWEWSEEEIGQINLCHYPGAFHNTCFNGDPVHESVCKVACLGRMCLHFMIMENYIDEYVNLFFSTNGIIGDLIRYEFIQKYAFLFIDYHSQYHKLYEEENYKLGKQILELRNSLSNYKDIFPNGVIGNTEKRAAIWDKSHGRCWYCGAYIHPFRDFEVDHVIPKAKGGSDDFQNLVPACRDCNRTKSDRTVEQFKLILRNNFVTSLSSEQIKILPMISRFLKFEHPAYGRGDARVDAEEFKLYFERKGLQA